MRAARARHNTFFISHACKLSCAHKVDDVKPTVQSSRVRTRRVHDACVHFRNAHAKFGLCVQANCKPRTAELKSINMFMYKGVTPRDTRHKSC